MGAQWQAHPILPNFAMFIFGTSMQMNPSEDSNIWVGSKCACLSEGKKCTKIIFYIVVMYTTFILIYLFNFQYRHDLTITCVHVCALMFRSERKIDKFCDKNS